jgi:hypothetical protein
LRHALGNQFPQAEATRLTRLLRQKDDSAYGHRALPLKDARDAIDKAETFAAWAEGALVGG